MPNLLGIQEDFVSAYNTNISMSQHSDLLRNIIGAWDMRFGNTGDEIRDYSGKERHGVITGTAPDWGTNELGCCWELPDNDEVATVGNGGELDNLRLISAVAVIKFADASTERTIITKDWSFFRDNTGGASFWASWTSGAWYGGLWKGTTNLTANKIWVIGVTYDGNLATNDPVIYVNGVAETPTQTSPNPAGVMVDDSATNMILSNATDPIYGQTNCIYLWNRILSPTEMIKINNILRTAA